MTIKGLEKYNVVGIYFKGDNIVVTYEKPKPEEKQRPIKRDHRKKKQRREKVRDRYKIEKKEKLHGTEC